MSILRTLGKWWWQQIICGALVPIMFWAPLMESVFLLGQASAAPAPTWWEDRAEITPEEAAEHFSPVNAGQLKWLATMLYEEMETLLPLGARLVNKTNSPVTINSLFAPAKAPHEAGYSQWSLTNSYAVNLGQTKNILQHYYRSLNKISPAWVKAQLAESGHSVTSAYKDSNNHYYPWTNSATDDENTSLINQGQLKLMFALRMRADTEANPDGLPDIFEHALIAMSNAEYAQYIGQAGATNPFRGLTLDKISWEGGDLNVSYNNGSGFQASNAPAPFPGLASANASVASLLDEHQAVGSVGGTFSAGSDGSANYSIPIDLPAGTAGMAPQIALGYSTTSGNGLLGLGFDIGGFQRITRGASSRTKDGFMDPVDFDVSDRFFLDGERLVLVYGHNAQPGAEYRTEKNSFARIFLKEFTDAEKLALGNPNHDLYWEIHTKSGNQVRLGYCSTSCVTHFGGDDPIVWNVSDVEDRHGNYYQVIWKSDGADTSHPNINNVAIKSRDYRPVQVKYTGQKNSAGEVTSDPYIDVNFEYEARPDMTFGFLHGTKMGTTWRLSGINVKTDEVLNYRYQFDYLDEDFGSNGTFTTAEKKNYLAQYQTLRSKLKKVTRYSAGGTALPPTTFTWQKPPSGNRWQDRGNYGLNTNTFHVYDTNNPSNSKRDLGFRWADMRGDGMIDLLRGYHHSPDNTRHSSGWRNTEDGFVSYANFTPPHDFVNTEQDNLGAFITDLNADGLPDQVFSRYSYYNHDLDSIPDNKKWTINDAHFVNGEAKPHISGFDLSYGYNMTSSSGAGVFIKEDNGFRDVRNTGDTYEMIVFKPEENHVVFVGPNYNSGNIPPLQYSEASTHFGDWNSFSAASVTHDSRVDPAHDYYNKPFLVQNGTLNDNDKYDSLGVELHDFDGNGLLDRYQSNELQNRIEFRNNEGIPFLYGSTEFVLPNGLKQYDTAEQRQNGIRGVDVIDINGDGALDLVRAQESDRQTWLMMSPSDNDPSINADPTTTEGLENTISSEWNKRNSYELPGALYKDDGSPTGSTLMDINGDGLLDFVSAGRDDRTDVIADIPLEHLWIRTHREKKTFGDDRDHMANLSETNPQTHDYKKKDHHKYYHLLYTEEDLKDQTFRNEGHVYVKLGYNIPDYDTFNNQIFLNTGTGFTRTSHAGLYKTGMPRLLFKDDGKDRGTFVQDFNGDGLPDVIELNHLTSLAARDVHINDGTGNWIQDNSFQANDVVKAYFNDTDITNGFKHVEVLDVNGDLFPDIVYNTGKSTPKVFLNRCVPEVITKVTDGLGSTIEAQYSFSNRNYSANGQSYDPYRQPTMWGSGNNAATIVEVGFAGYLLVRYSESDGKGGRNWRRRTYGPKYADRVNEVDLGFAWIEEVDEKSGGRSIIEFMKKSTVRADVWQAQNVRAVDGSYTLGITTYPYHQMPVKEYSLSPSGKVIAHTQHEYGHTSIPSGYGTTSLLHVFQAKSTKWNYLGDGTEISKTITDNTDGAGNGNFDEWGNLTKQTTTTIATSGSRMGESKTVTLENTYGTSVTYRKVGRLTHAKTTTVWKPKEGGTYTRVKNANFTYNSKLLLQSETAHEAGSDGTAGTSLKKTYKYDSWGNKYQTRVEPLNASNLPSEQPRTTGVTYGQKGRFVSKSYFYSGSQKIETTQNTYDFKKALLLKSVDLQSGFQTSFFYDEFGTKILTRDYMGLESAEITKRASNSEKAPAGASVDPAADITFIRKSQSSGGPPSVAFIDSLGRVVLTCTTGFDGKTLYQQTIYDSLGREWKKSQPYFSGDAPLYSVVTYDEVNRPIQTSNPDGTKDISDFGVAFEVGVSRKDPSGSIISARRKYVDLTGQTVKSRDVGGNEVTFSNAWTAGGTTIVTTAPGKNGGTHTITTKLDLWGNKVLLDDPNTGVHTTTYDALGNVLTTTDAKGQVTTNIYDTLGRKVRVERPEGDIVYHYDDTGSRAVGYSKRALYKVVQYTGSYTVGNAYYTETYDFDRYGRTIRTTTETGGRTITTSSTYDELGRAHTETDAGGLTLLHTYDEFSNNTSLIDYHTGEVYWKPVEYNAQGQLLREEMGDGLVRNKNVYQPLNGTLIANQSGTASNENAYQHLAYHWDHLGNLLVRHSKTAGHSYHETFGYDSSFRLASNTFNGTGENGGGNKNDNVTYGYTDETGNLASMPKSSGNNSAGKWHMKYEDSNATHRLTSVRQGASASNSSLLRTYQYDNNGAITAEIEGSNTRRSYFWNSFHKPTQIIHSDTNYKVLDWEKNEFQTYKQTKVNFEYGPSNARLKQTQSSTNNLGVTEKQTTTRYWGSFEEIETTEGSVTTTKFRHSIGGFAMKEYTSQDVNGTRGPPSQAETKYFIKDHLGSTTVVLSRDDHTDNTISVKERLSFDAWGRARHNNGWKSPAANSTVSSQETTRGFTGHEMLDSIGLVHMNGRIYDAEIGRFLTPDPAIQEPDNSQNFNRYSYVLNNPVSYTDPTGYLFKSVFNFFSGIFKGIASAVKAVVKAVKSAARWVQKNWRTVVSTAFAYVVHIGLNILIPGAFIVNGAIAGFINGAFNAALNGGDIGDIIRGAVVGGVTGAMTGALHHMEGALGLGSKLMENGKSITRNAFAAAKSAGQYASLAGRALVHSVSHGLVGGLRNVMMGQKFKDGFMSTAVSTLAGHSMGASGLDLGYVGNGAVQATVGGTASRLSGGTFSNGAQTATFHYLFNSAAGGISRKNIAGGLRKVGNWFKSNARNIADGFGVAADLWGGGLSMVASGKALAEGLAVDIMSPFVPGSGAPLYAKSIYDAADSLIQFRSAGKGIYRMWSGNETGHVSGGVMEMVSHNTFGTDAGKYGDLGYGLIAQGNVARLGKIVLGSQVGEVARTYIPQGLHYIADRIEGR